MLGVTSFLLVLYYNNLVALRGAMETLISNRLGDLFLIFVIVIREWSIKTLALRFLINFLLVLAS